MQVGTKDLLEFRGEDKVFCIVISLLHICMMILATLKVWPADAWKAAPVKSGSLVLIHGQV